MKIASDCTKASKVVYAIARTANVLDTVGAAVSTTRSAVGVAENGLKLENGTELVGGLL